MMQRLKGFSGVIERWQFWILASFIFVSLIFSTSLSFGYGPEATISNGYFTSQGQISTSNDPLFQDYGTDNAMPTMMARTFWKWTSFYGDSAYYLEQSRNLDLRASIGPYKYRVLPTSVAFAIHRVFGLSLPLAWAAMNIVCTYLIGVVFVYFCKRGFGFSNLLSLLGGVLAITSVGITRTLPFPMVDPAEYLLFLLVLLSLRIKNDWLYLTCAICCVLTKELLIFVGFLYLVNNYSALRTGRLSFVRTTLLSLAPVIVFSVLRLSLGGHAMEVNYGYDILAGEFPDYVTRFLSLGGVITLLSVLFLSFQFLWLGLLNIGRDRWLWVNTILALPLVIVPTILLSGHITRVVGVLFPLVIVSFLFFFKRHDAPVAGELARDAQ
jgi:hypothetical protein